MPLEITAPEIVGVTESEIALTFAVEGDAGPVADPVEVRVDGEVRATCEGPAGTRSVRLTGLDPERAYRVRLGLPGQREVPPDRYFPEAVTTLPAPAGAPVASFATLNDLHFGEARFGGTLLDDGDYGDEAPGFPVVTEKDTEVPYWRFMNEDAVAEINAAGVDATVIKGDIADRGRPEQFEWARETFARLAEPHHAFLGNHDHYGRLQGLEVDGYALLEQPPAPRTVELGGWRLVLLDTVEPGKHHGIFPPERRRWLEETLEAAREERTPTLLFTHHQPVPPEHVDEYPNSIGLRPKDSLPLFDLIGRHPQVRGVLIGHTHRNRVRHYPAAGAVPFVEVNCTKDFPGGWGHYRLFDDGSFRQEVRRTSSERALAHSTRCAGFFKGMYRHFALGKLDQRSFAVPGSA